MYFRALFIRISLCKLSALSWAIGKSCVELKSCKPEKSLKSSGSHCTQLAHHNHHVVLHFAAFFILKAARGLLYEFSSYIAACAVSEETCFYFALRAAKP